MARLATVPIFAAVVTAACGGGILPGVSRDVPDNAREPRAYFEAGPPPQGFTTANAWLEVATLRRTGGNGTAEIAYLRLWARASGSDVLLMGDDYSRDGACGTDFARDPTWGGDERPGHTFPTNGGALPLDPSARPDRILHPYGCRYPRESFPAGTSRVWMETLVRVSGDAAVQAGLDYFATPRDTPIHQAGVSDWILAGPDWQYVAVGKP